MPIGRIKIKSPDIGKIVDMISSQKIGEAFEAGDWLFCIEVCKMEVDICFEGPSAQLKQIHVYIGKIVYRDEIVLEFEPLKKFRSLETKKFYPQKISKN